jgi:hypothetical protein
VHPGGRKSGKEITSPFSLFAKVKGGKISYVQFLEIAPPSSAIRFDLNIGPVFAPAARTVARSPDGTTCS